jgi:hypothetical protein
VLDGRTPQVRRGKNAAAFKRKEYPVLIAGMDSMGEGHSFDQCSHLIMPSITWAYDTNAQAIERVHRLTSQKPVNIYTFVTKNTIDEKLQNIFTEKSNSSDLALDGRIGKHQTHEINLAELLSSAIDSFDPEAETINESTLESTWPTVAARLYAATQKPSIPNPVPTSPLITDHSTLETKSDEPTIHQIAKGAATLNIRLANEEIGVEDYTIIMEFFMEKLIEVHHQTPEQITAILTATQPPQEPATATNALTSEQHGQTLSTFQQGDKVYRNYNGKYEAYEIIDTKKDVWKLRRIQGIAEGSITEWNTQNNGGFLLCRKETPTTKKPDQSNPPNPSNQSPKTTAPTPERQPLTTRFPFKKSCLTSV